MANFIKGAIRHPGREKRRSAEHGISVHEQMVRDSHSDNPSLRGAGALGLRLTGGDLHHAHHGGVHGRHGHGGAKRK